MTSITEIIMNLKNDVEEAVSLMQQAERILRKTDNKNFKAAAAFLRQSCQSIEKHKVVKTKQLFVRSASEIKNQSQTTYGE